MSNPDPDGEAAHVTVTEARGAERTGRNIWILVVSLVLIVVVMIGYWLVQAPRLAAINHPQVRDMNAQDVATFHTPGGSARGAPPDARGANEQ